MQIDDEVIFGRALDESRECLARIESLRSEPALAIAANARQPESLEAALAEFELHGSTLRSLAQWYPNERRIRLGFFEWELFNFRLNWRSVKF